ERRAKSSVTRKLRASQPGHCPIRTSCIAHANHERAARILMFEKALSPLACEKLASCSFGLHSLKLKMSCGSRVAIASATHADLDEKISYERRGREREREREKEETSHTHTDSLSECKPNSK